MRIDQVILCFFSNVLKNKRFLFNLFCKESVFFAFHYEKHSQDQAYSKMLTIHLVLLIIALEIAGSWVTLFRPKIDSKSFFIGRFSKSKTIGGSIL